MTGSEREASHVALVLTMEWQKMGNPTTEKLGKTWTHLYETVLRKLLNQEPGK